MNHEDRQEQYPGQLDASGNYQTERRAGLWITCVCKNRVILMGCDLDDDAAEPWYDTSTLQGAVYLSGPAGNPEGRYSFDCGRCSRTDLQVSAKTIAAKLQPLWARCRADGTPRTARLTL